MSNKLIIKRLEVGQLATNCYILADQLKNEAIIVDPGDDGEYIHTILRDLSVKPIKIIATHGHFDHILAAFELQQAYSIPFLVHEKDAFLIKRMQETAEFFLKIKVPDLSPEINGKLTEKEEVKVGNTSFQIMETPGHSPGSICLYSEENHCVLTGDTLFARGGVGRTDFKYASSSDLQNSLAKLFSLPQNTRIYPGHGESSEIFKEAALHT